jgi:ADP-ribose pyrophosphatase
MYTTPGFTDERIHLFMASVLSEGEHQREVDEFLELVPTRWSVVLDLIRKRDIMDGKTLSALLYAGAFRVGRG